VAKVNNTKIIKAALEKWGEKLQMIIAIEEMSELTKELTKFQRGRGRLANVKEEIADVDIMLTHLKLIFGDCEKEKTEKLQKLRMYLK
jgi:NTP pyrophosphatase (non-canonical NTP hydrolase)